MLKFPLLVVDWIENKLIPNFSILVNLVEAGLRIHYEFCPAQYFLGILSQTVLPESMLDLSLFQSLINRKYFR